MKKKMIVIAALMLVSTSAIADTPTSAPSWWDRVIGLMMEL